MDELWQSRDSPYMIGLEDQSSDEYEDEEWYRLDLTTVEDLDFIVNLIDGIGYGDRRNDRYFLILSGEAIFDAVLDAVIAALCKMHPAKEAVRAGL